jgi:hypothetical protein
MRGAYHHGSERALLGKEVVEHLEAHDEMRVLDFDGRIFPDFSLRDPRRRDLRAWTGDGRGLRRSGRRAGARW